MKQFQPEIHKINSRSQSYDQSYNASVAKIYNATMQYIAKCVLRIKVIFLRCKNALANYNSAGVGSYKFKSHKIGCRSVLQQVLTTAARKFSRAPKMYLIETRVARFFFAQYTKAGKNIPNDCIITK
jgi:hypothetical protein